MTTVINNPGNGEGSGSGVGIIIGVVVLLVVVGLFFVYALPAIRSSRVTPQNGNIDVKVNLPNVNVALPAVNASPPTP
ncbi:MAG: hypothetical protein WC768_00190 [Patescibacteria group bacterium]|jgi:hypothetical protein